MREGNYFTIKTFSSDGELLEINYNVEGRPRQPSVGVAEFSWARQGNELTADVKHDTTYPNLLLTAPPGYQTIRDSLSMARGSVSTVWYGAESVLVQLSEAGIGQWSAKFKIPGDEPLANWWLITVCSAPCYTPALYGDTEYVFFFPGLTDEDFNPSDASAPFLFSVISSYLLFG